MIICIDALTLILFLHYLLYLQVEVTRVSVIAVLLIAAAANMVIVVVIAKARNSCEPVLVQFHPVCYMYVRVYILAMLYRTCSCVPCYCCGWCLSFFVKRKKAKPSSVLAPQQAVHISTYTDSEKRLNHAKCIYFI